MDRPCSRRWGNKRLFGHLGKLHKEMKAFPDDGSIELELAECEMILKERGALV
jgi:hypothetical protein